MTYKVIIADDEPRIIDLIKALGHWNDFDIEIIDCCQDGRSALTSILEKKPDIVISDIKMPELDGIEMIQEARKHNCSTQFILLSGYRQFEYARSAISLNVVDYLLKPVNEEQLNSTLSKVVHKLKEEADQKNHRQELADFHALKQKEKIDRLFDDIAWDTHDQEFLMNFTSVERCEEIYGITLPYNSFQVVLCATSMTDSVDQDNSLFFEETGRLIHQSFDANAMVYCKVQNIGCSILLNFDDSMKNKVWEEINALYTGICNLSEIYGKFSLNFGCSREKHAVSELRDAVHEARAADWCRFNAGHCGIFTYDQVLLLRTKPVHLFSEEDRNGIADCVKYLRIDEMSEFFRKADSTLKAAPEGLSPGILAADYFELLNAVRKQASEDYRKELHQKLTNAMLNANTVSRLIQNIFVVLQDYILAMRRNMKMKMKRPINEAMSYINLHYAEAIAETDVADACNVSAAYLSKLFKEEMNMGFAEYLTQVRMEKAENLLANTTMTIRDIANAVGYPDEKYFSRIYKKLNGIKPTEYRKLYG